LCWSAVRRTAPNKNVYVQLAQLHPIAIYRCSSAKCTNEFLLGAVCRMHLSVTLFILWCDCLYFDDTMHIWAISDVKK